MKNNETPVAEQTAAGGYKSVLVHELIENPLFLLRDPSTQPLIGGIDTKVLNSRWLITRWRTTVRVVTLLSSLVSIGLTIFQKQLAATLKFDSNGLKMLEWADFSCKDSGSVMFFMYVNVAVFSYSFLQLIMSTFLKRNNAVAEKIPTSMRWSAFVLHVVAVELLLLAVVAAWIIDVLNSYGAKIFVDQHSKSVAEMLYPECSDCSHINIGGGSKAFRDPFGHQSNKCIEMIESCSIQSPNFSLVMGVSVLSYVSLLAGTCLDAYRLIKRTESKMMQGVYFGK